MSWEKRTGLAGSEMSLSDDNRPETIRAIEVEIR